MKITTWSDVQMQISLHKLPYSVLRFNMSLTGVLIDTATGDTLACTIRDAAHVIQGAAAPPSTSVTSETPKPLGLQMADDIASALMPKRSTSISLSPAEVLAVDLMGKQAKAQLAKSDTEIAQTVLARPDQPVRRLYCCCCGGSFQGRQFHNQDTGHGMGECCADRVLEHRPFGHEPITLAEFERTYGIRGYHFDLPRDTQNGFDYKHQAWVKDGKYLRCGHDPMMAGCNCYGRLHEGEPVAADADIQ